MKKDILKKSLIVLMMLVSVLVLSGCGNNNEENNNNTNNESNSTTADDLSSLPVYNMETLENYTEYKDEASGAIVNYPSGWETLDQDGQKLFRDSTLTGASLNINSADIPEAMSFDAFIGASIEGIKQQMTIDGDVAQEWINLNGRKAAKIDYVAKQTDSTNVTIEQIVFIENNKAYILTIAVLSDNYDLVKTDIENIVKSFRI